MSLSKLHSDGAALPGLGALRGRDYISVLDFSSEEILLALDVAGHLKRLGRNAPAPFDRQVLALYFEKQSLRTRVTFEAGIVQLGGHPVYLTPADAGFGTRESVPDAGRNLSRWVQGIVARTYSHDLVRQLAEYATVPVINALSDWEHPCQAMADFQTIVERVGSPKGFTLAWVGDGNNVCHSLMLMGARLGTHLRIAVPSGYEPNSKVVQIARAEAAKTGGSIEITDDPREAVRGVGAISTDVWTSMGQEAEKEKRLRDFVGFQVNAEMMALAADGAFFLHCLPAHRGEEVTDEVMDGPHSAVFDQAENRLHAQKAIMAMTMG